jgi:hypothetical protein
MKQQRQNWICLTKQTNTFFQEFKCLFINMTNGQSTNKFSSISKRKTIDLLWSILSCTNCVWNPLLYRERASQTTKLLQGLPCVCLVLLSKEYMSKSIFEKVLRQQHISECRVPQYKLQAVKFKNKMQWLSE